MLRKIEPGMAKDWRLREEKRESRMIIMILG
jgi:hypothetical protein